MTDGGSAAADAERASDVGWEPADWDLALRHRRRTELSRTALLLLCFLVVFPLVRVLLVERPIGWRPLAWGLWVLLLGVPAWWYHFTARGRTAWEAETRQEIRIDHALRRHVSIGAANRYLVTERAEKIDSRALAHFVGWPLLGVLGFAGVETAEGLSLGQEVVGGLVIALVCAALVLLAWRRVRRARRWLADPLPRDEEPA